MHRKKKFEDALCKAPMMELFPPIKPYSTGYLQVEEPHELFWAQYGNPEGVPVVFLHGGPGAGCFPQAPQFFDPDFYRIIIFDQRGAGKSTPSAHIENNTAQDLVNDIEKLREHLKIEKWHVFGGSWGSTLALLYADQHADKILSMVLRAIFLLEQDGVEWLLYDMKNIFPEAWEQFVSIIPEDERDDLLEAYYQRLTDEDEDVHMEAAMSWSLYESACASLIPNYEIITTDEQKQQALNISRIECHFFRNEMINPQDSLLNKVDNFRHVPTTIIHGRYDVICPIYFAHQLHTQWPEADFIVAPDAGHSANEPAIRSRLIEATENMKTIRA